MIKNKGIFPFSEYLVDLADELAQIRSKMSKNVYNDKTEKYRGEEEQRVSSLGVLGELIAREHFKSIIEPTTNYKFTPIIEFNLLPEPDLYIKGMRVDIKTIPEDKNIFMVNEPAYKNPDKKVNWYWYVKLKGNYNCEHWLVESSDVSEWELKKFRYTNAYWCEIPKEYDRVI